ncbi:tumor necrosis factor ligand superfamily member 14-like isoform 1-T2 [Pholidichthys leucotaenia]
MSEGEVGAGPHVFVVDSQASYIHMPTEKKRRWTRTGQNLLLLLVGLTMLGLTVQAFLIYNLYKKTETFSFSSSNGPYQNTSNPKASKQSGPIMIPVGSGESNEVHLVQTQTYERPFAHLIGPNNIIGDKNEVQFLKEGEAVTNLMKYNNSRLTVEKEGYYYIYSKVQLNAAEECVLIQHKVIKHSGAYGKPIPLMKSKSNRCSTSRPSGVKSSGREDLWNSFLAGIFHLQSADEIYVTLENIHTMRPGPSENFMGAFMIYP